MHRRFWTTTLLTAAVAIGGCRGKGPTPKKGPAADTATATETTATAETTGAANTMKNPHATGEIPLDNPHVKGESPTEMPPPGGAVDVGAITITPPKAWRFEKPTSSMRRAQFKVPGTKGEAELIVYFFGAAGAGTNQANIDRWVGQFKNDDGSSINATPAQSKIAGFDVMRVEVVGSYEGGMGATSPSRVPGQRLLAAIVQTPGGPYYFKLLGPNTSVSENRSAFDGLLQSMVASP